MNKNNSALLQFFGNPIVHLIVAFGLVLAITLTPNRTFQIIGIAILAVVLASGSVLFRIYQEKIAAAKYMDENRELREKIEKLGKEKETLTKIKEELEHEIPKIIKYNNVVKEIRIKNANGDAIFSLSYEGVNESGNPIDRLKTDIHTKKEIIVESASVNEESVTPTVEHVLHDDKCKSEIILPIRKAVPPEKPIKYGYEAHFKGEYDGAFGEGTSSTAHRINLPTDIFTVRIRAPPRFIFYPNPNIQVRDIFNDIEVHNEEDRILRDYPPFLDAKRQKIVWTIKWPKISYKYLLFFQLKKGTTKK